MNIPVRLLYLCLLCICFKAKSQTARQASTLAEGKISAGKKDSILPLLRLGGIYEEKKDYFKAIDAYLEAIKIAETHKLYRDINAAYGCILNMYYYTGDYPSAMAIAQKGLALAEQQHDREMLAHYNEQFGFIYLKQEQPVESIKYYRQYLNLAMQMNKQMLLAHGYTCMADVCVLQKDWRSSFGFLFSALAIYESADSLEMRDHKDDSEIAGIIAYTLYQISNTYKLQGNYRLAMQYALNGLNYHKGRGYTPSCNKYDLASYYINAGEVYRALEHYPRAIYFLNRGLALSRSILHREDMRAAYNGLSKTYALEKRYDSAYYYQNLYSVLKDSIINENASRAVEQIRSSFENDKKDKEIALLKQEQKLKEIASENRNLLFIVLSGFLVLLAVISFPVLYIRNKQKKQKVDYEKRLAIQTERQRISGDMHDDIGTGLSTMLIYVNMLKTKLAGSSEYPDVQRVALLGNDLVMQMREIVWSFNPGNDSLESLLIFVRQYFAQLFEPLSYETRIIFPESIPAAALNGIIRRNIYLCIKEALNNVIKHSGAHWIELNIQVSRDKLNIAVRDNGIGFPANSDGQFWSNGLKNMQSRMDQVKGRFQFFNERGAVIVIEVPLPEVPQKVVVL
jgi:signal transduction histidine kinase